MRRAAVAAFGIAILSVCVYAWSLVPQAPAAPPPKRQVDNPHPAWMTEGRRVYIAAFVGYRIARTEMASHALRLEQLKCDNTQSCAYVVDQCAPWTIELASDADVRLRSPEGLSARGVGPWTAAFEDRAACLAAAKKRGDRMFPDGSTPLTLSE